MAATAPRGAAPQGTAKTSTEATTTNSAKTKATARWGVPAFVREVEHESFRPKLLAGIATGYSTAVVLGLLAWAAGQTGVLPRTDWAYALVATKLITNTLAGVAWRTRRGVLPLSALNITADVLVMTGGIYFTGGVLSPIVAVYFIEVAVMALLTNLGLTVTVMLGCVAAYASMAMLVHAGTLPAIEPLATSVAAISTPMLFVTIALMAFTIFVPGLYVAIIVEQLRRSEVRLRARAAELVEAGRAKSEFTANITHELRTPLHGILGVGEILEDGVYGALNPAQTEAVQTIRESARGLLGLIDALLVVARSEALKLEVRASEVDVTELLSSVVASAKLAIGRRPMNVVVDIEGTLPPITTDRQKLVHVLQNLLANAIKFTPDGGTVRVEAREEQGQIVIAIEDTGVGISPEQLETIFEPFVQGDGSEVREHGGAGLGLAVVRTLSTLLHVVVEVKSELGRGTVFTLRLPRSVT